MQNFTVSKDVPKTVFEFKIDAVFHVLLYRK